MKKLRFQRKKMAGNSRGTKNVRKPNSIRNKVKKLLSFRCMEDQNFKLPSS